MIRPSDRVQAVVWRLSQAGYVVTLPGDRPVFWLYTPMAATYRSKLICSWATIDADRSEDDAFDRIMRHWDTGFDTA